MKSVPSLTGIRGVAALWVLWYHVQQDGRLFHLPWLQGARVVERGWAGVDLFFILSGFILTHAHGHEFIRLDRKPLVQFAKLRIARVYPLNLAVLLIIAALAVADPKFAAWYGGRAAGNFSGPSFVRTALLATRWFLPGAGDWNQPVWSLSAEILGYAMFPFIAMTLMACRSFRAALSIAFASLAALALLQILTHSANTNSIGQFGAITRMGFCFFGGAALCRAKTLAPSSVAPHGIKLSIVAVGLIVVTAIPYRTAIVMPTAFAILIFSLSFELGPVHRLLSCRPFMFLGRISFPLYLFHLMPLMWIGYQFRVTSLSPASGVAIICAYVTGCLAAATVLHRCIERPAHRLGRVWANRTSRTAKSAPAQPA